MGEFKLVVYTGDKVFLAFQSMKVDIEVLNDVITVKDKKDKRMLIELHGFPFTIIPAASEYGWFLRAKACEFL